MATSPSHNTSHEYHCMVSARLPEHLSTRSTRESNDMEVKGHLITGMSLSGPDLQGCGDSKQCAERVSELQERRRSLQSLLNARLGELRRICLLEAELTGELPSEYPLEVGEKPPHVRRRAGLGHRGPKHSHKGEEEEGCHWKYKKALFRSALRRQSDSEHQASHGKKTVHRGCHTDEMVQSESSSMSDSTGQDNEDSSPSVGPDSLSPSRPQLAPGSPDSRLCRKLSPVEVYYEMRTRRNSVASSSSPSRSLPRSMSNVEGRSVPATPLLSRTVPSNGHVRPEAFSSVATQQWPDSPDGPHMVPLHSQDGASSGSFERGSCPYSTRTRRSNSSEALLDRTVFPEDGAQRNGMPNRGGPYKSSEVLTDGRLRQVQQISPERHVNGHVEQGRMRSSVGGRGGGGGGYNEILMDYIWGKQQKMQVQQQQQQQRHQPVSSVKSRVWPDGSSLPISAATANAQFNGFPQSQPAQHFGAGPPPPYSPLMLRGKPGDPRRVKVTRTKSCGPFIPLQQQQETVLFSGYSEFPNLAAGSSGSSAAALYPCQTEQAAPSVARRQAPFSSTTPEDSTRSLHKALALEGLRDWYLRNTLGQGAPVAKGQESAQPRRRTTHGHVQVEQPYSQCHNTHMPQSATFHGHPLHGRSMELSLYQESFSSQMQDLTLKEPNAEPPAPGTLV
ncbi:coiled-coil domain-containing protein 120-like [Scleropages formosus]|uniref:Coiled-coil domain containing 120a n=1 Tax=Scleropages formosus TaxID=113540 RepID=A0A0P7X390_SCLFO|nr:coiled-coil domain-containing protein 120-like [Scleropages formosus]KPP68466.1 coiled-coil domain-containing protein 120-like [Scleropages formosus]